jgi:hypothetical protein
MVQDARAPPPPTFSPSNMPNPQSILKVTSILIRRMRSFFLLFLHLLVSVISQAKLEARMQEAKLVSTKVDDVEVPVNQIKIFQNEVPVIDDVSMSAQLNLNLDTEIDVQSFKKNDISKVDYLAEPAALVNEPFSLDRSGEMMCCAQRNNYIACDTKNFVNGCEGFGDCCFCMSYTCCFGCCIDPIKCGSISLDDEKAECCNCGMLCCSCSCRTPSMKVAERWRCCCCTSAGASPYAVNVVETFVCAFCCLSVIVAKVLLLNDIFHFFARLNPQCAPECGFCKPSITKDMKFDDPIEAKPREIPLSLSFDDSAIEMNTVFAPKAQVIIRATTGE